MTFLLMAAKESVMCPAIGTVANEAPKKHKRNYAHVNLAFSFRFLSAWLIVQLKNVLKTLCIRYWSPGARVGQAWLNVVATNGMAAAVSAFSFPCVDWLPSSGIDSGRFGLCVAIVVMGGMPSMSLVNPGTMRTTTRCTSPPFSTFSQFGGGTSARRCNERSRMSY